mgnify:CR=1 FL=1
MDPLPSTSSSSTSHVAPLSTVVHSQVNSMNNDPLPWNVLQQRYMDVNRARNDQQQHAQTVRDLLNPTVSNNSTENVRPVLSVSTPSTTVLTSPPTSTSSFSTTHVDPPTAQSQPVTTQPVVASADSAISATQSGLITTKFCCPNFPASDITI